MPVGPFASLSGQSLWEVRWDTPACCLPNIKSLSGSRGENFSYFCPVGTLGKWFCQFCFRAMKWSLDLWLPGTIVSQWLQDGVASQPTPENVSEEFFFHVSCLFIPWLTSASDSKLWTATQYGSFSFPPPTYWSSSAQNFCFSLCLWGKSISREQFQDLTEKAGVWCEAASVVQFKQELWDPDQVFPEPLT